MIDLAGSGTIRVGMVGNELVLDSVSPAESWETVGRFVHPERVEVSFESAQGDVVGAVVELVDGRAVVRVADTRTGEEETMFLDDLDPLTVEID